MTLPLNLASRPFKNETLPALLTAGMGVVLLGLTLWQGLVLRRLNSGDTTALQKEAAALDAEEARLRQRILELRPQRPDRKVLAEWNMLKDLVDRRTFSWTLLFERIEQLEPSGVRLTAVRPHVSKGVIQVEIDAVVRSSEQGLAFVHALEDSPDFSDVYPLSVSSGEKKDPGQRKEGIEYRYTMHYEEQPRQASAVKPAAKEGEGQDSGEGTEGTEEQPEGDPGDQQPGEAGSGEGQS
jgi:Tfp pilus assembly protein PilN